LNVIILNTPHGYLIKISSSSYELSIFSLKTGSHHDEGTGAVRGESSSVSIGGLWREINNLDEASCEGTSSTATQNHREDPASHPLSNSGGSKRKVREDVVHAAEKASLDETPGWSSAPPRGCVGGSVRSKATWILSDAPEAILPHMRRSFADRQYSPSTGMDQSEWEIILEDLTHMGYIVTEQPVSETDD
jgi:hypothetical protein